MSEPLDDALVACHGCGRLHRLEALTRGQAARCGRCGTVLERAKIGGLDRTLAFTLTGLVLFVLANTYPLLTFELEGRSQQAHLITGVIGLYDQGMWELAALVFVASILAPFLQLMGLLYLLVPLKFGRRPWKLGPTYRLVGKIGFWAMLEVYLLGIIVALVKLADFGTVVPDVALYAFFGLILVIAAASFSLDPRAIWQRVELES
ncbi:MAG: paraquat-inducible protein A [Pseudomonadota bacterium]